MEAAEEFSTAVFACDLVGGTERVANGEKVAVVLHDVLLIAHFVLAGFINEVHEALSSEAGDCHGVRVQIFESLAEGTPVTH